jgi:hypothetical protein
MVPGPRICPVAGRPALIRRVASVALFVLGACMLMSETFLAWIDLGQGWTVELAAMGIMGMISVPFLLMGLWISPGNRIAELGTTLISAAIVGGVTALMLFIILRDPALPQLMPPDRPMPDFTPSPLVGVINLAAVGGIGWALFRIGKKRELRLSRGAVR